MTGGGVAENFIRDDARIKCDKTYTRKGQGLTLSSGSGCICGFVRSYQTAQHGACSTVRPHQCVGEA